jgi:hypothetical protein
MCRSGLDAGRLVFHVMSEEPNARRCKFPWRLTTILLLLAFVAMAFVARREHSLKKQALHKLRSRNRAARKAAQWEDAPAPVSPSWDP